MEIFDTPRLSGRYFTLDDTLALTKILSDPEVMKYSIRGVCDEEATQNFINWCLECYILHKIGPCALIEKSANCLVGFCGINPEMVNNVEEASLGYRLARKTWGSGLATEATRAVLNYSFEVIPLPSIIVIIEPENTASLRVIKKLGFIDDYV